MEDFNCRMDFFFKVKTESTSSVCHFTEIHDQYLCHTAVTQCDLTCVHLLLASLDCLQHR